MPRLERKVLVITLAQEPDINYRFIRAGRVLFWGPFGEGTPDHKAILGEMVEAGFTEPPDDAGYFCKSEKGEVLFKAESTTLGVGMDFEQRTITGEVVQTDIATSDMVVRTRPSRHAFRRRG